MTKYKIKHNIEQREDYILPFVLYFFLLILSGGVSFIMALFISTLVEAPHLFYLMFAVSMVICQYKLILEFEYSPVTYKKVTHEIVKSKK